MGFYFSNKGRKANEGQLKTGMSLFTILFLAVGLAMDAFAVSVSNGMCYKNVGKREMLLTALTFGVFQALMPVIGYWAGTLFRGAISAVDHWIALVLLGLIGGKMVFDGMQELKSPQACELNKALTGKVLFLQGVATSIDALAVGISLSVMQANILTSAGAIGAVTFTISLFGCGVGRKCGEFLKEKAEIFGGVILIAIGIKVFLEHMLG